MEVGGSGREFQGPHSLHLVCLLHLPPGEGHERGLHDGSSHGGIEQWAAVAGRTEGPKELWEKALLAEQGSCPPEHCFFPTARHITCSADAGRGTPLHALLQSLHPRWLPKLPLWSTNCVWTHYFNGGTQDKKSWQLQTGRSYTRASLRCVAQNWVDKGEAYNQISWKHEAVIKGSGSSQQRV